MKSPKLSLLLLVMKSSKLSLLLLGLASVGANAATVSYGPITAGPFATGSSGNFNIPQFDPALGTLISVTLDVTGKANGGSTSAENFTVSPGSITASIGTNITVTGPSSLSVLTVPATSNTASVTAFDGFLDFAGSSAMSVSGTAASDNDFAILLTGFASYIGLGNVSFNFTSALNSSTSSSLTPVASINTPGSFEFDTLVTYNFTPIPEPSVPGVMAVAVGVLAMSRRRNRP